MLDDVTSSDLGLGHDVARTPSSRARSIHSVISETFSFVACRHVLGVLDDERGMESLAEWRELFAAGSWKRLFQLHQSRRRRQRRLLRRLERQVGVRPRTPLFRREILRVHHSSPARNGPGWPRVATCRIGFGSRTGRFS